MAGRRQVGRDQPVAIAVLERLGHPRGEEQEDGREPDQRREWHRHAHPCQRGETEPSESHDLDVVEKAQGGHDKKANREKPGVDGQQELAHADRQG